MQNSKAADPARTIEAIDKPKRGRRPKPDAEKTPERICLRMWEDEYELFAEEGKLRGMASFLREAVHELIESRARIIDAPKPVGRELGSQFTMFLSVQDKVLFDEVAASMKLPLSGLIRAAGKWKAGR